jgi:hypothetical protein
MADIHLLAGDGNGCWTVVMHIAIPSANNNAGVNWRTALVNSGLGGTTAMTEGDGTNGTISTAEKESIEAGAIYEHSRPFRLESATTGVPEQRAALRALYAQQDAIVIAEIQRRLKYFGHTESKS